MSVLTNTASLFPPLVRESDLTLLEAAKQMDRDALVQIFDLYSPGIYNYAFRLCQDAVMADHIVGDVFAKLLEHLAAGRGPTTNLRSYLYEMAYHMVVDEARYGQRSMTVENIDLLPQGQYSTTVSVEERLMFENILRAIQTHLTVDQRHVIILRFLEGFSLQDTAAIIGKEVSNVKVIQSRAVAALRKALNINGVT